MAAQARISSKFQTVIPKTVRERLGLRTGDLLRFDFATDGTVTVEKVRESDDDPFVSFHEWTSEEDERLYRDL
jgi:antitoxin PrlF